MVSEAIEIQKRTKNPRIDAIHADDSRMLLSSTLERYGDKLQNSSRLWTLAGILGFC